MTTLTAEYATSIGLTANAKNGTAAKAKAAPSGCENASAISASPTCITSAVPLRARRSKRARHSINKNIARNISDGPATTARSNAGWNVSNSATTKLAVRDRPSLQSEPKQNAARRPSSPAATSAGAGVSAGTSQATSVVERNGKVGYAATIR